MLRVQTKPFIIVIQYTALLIKINVLNYLKYLYKGLGGKTSEEFFVDMFPDT